MGYYMSIRSENFEMEPDQFAGALAAIKTLMGKVKELGHGGCWSGGKQTEWHFTWVTTDTVLNATTLYDAMKEWRWGLDFLDDQNSRVIGIEFRGEKIGQDELLFEAIAPFVKDGSYIEMNGGDGSIWRWLFKGGKCVEQNATVSYGDDE